MRAAQCKNCHKKVDGVYIEGNLVTSDVVVYCDISCQMEDNPQDIDEV